MIYFRLASACAQRKTRQKAGKEEKKRENNPSDLVLSPRRNWGAHNAHPDPLANSWGFAPQTPQEQKPLNYNVGGHLEFPLNGVTHC